MIYVFTKHFKIYVSNGTNVYNFKYKFDYLNDILIY